MASVCALLPSVSENDRNSASTAIKSAILLFECDGVFGVLGMFQLFVCFRHGLLPPLLRRLPAMTHSMKLHQARGWALR